MIWRLFTYFGDSFEILSNEGEYKGAVWKQGHGWRPSYHAKQNVPKHILDRFINQLERGYDKQTTTTNQGT